jgi:hypothetical protein
VLYGTWAISVRARGRSWLIDLRASAVGWLVAAVILIVVGTRPSGAVLIGGIAASFLVTAADARIRGGSVTRGIMWTAAVILITWPVFTVIAVFVYYWTTGESIYD